MFCTLTPRQALSLILLTCTGVAADLGAQGIRKYPNGVDAKTEATIKRGLEYLVRTQDRSGAWRATGYGAYPTAMTALAGETQWAMRLDKGRRAEAHQRRAAPRCFCLAQVVDPDHEVHAQ